MRLHLCVHHNHLRDFEMRSSTNVQRIRLCRTKVTVGCLTRAHAKSLPFCFLEQTPNYGFYQSKVGHVKLQPDLASPSGKTTHCKVWERERDGRLDTVSSVPFFYKCFEPRGSVEGVTPECKIYHQSGEKCLGAVLKRTRNRFECSILQILTLTISSMQLLTWMNRQMKHFFALSLSFSSLQFRLNGKHISSFSHLQFHWLGVESMDLK